MTKKSESSYCGAPALITDHRNIYIKSHQERNLCNVHIYAQKKYYLHYNALKTLHSATIRKQNDNTKKYVIHSLIKFRILEKEQTLYRELLHKLSVPIVLDLQSF